MPARIRDSFYVVLTVPDHADQQLLMMTRDGASQTSAELFLLLHSSLSARWSELTDGESGKQFEQDILFPIALDP